MCAAVSPVLMASRKANCDAVDAFGRTPVEALKRRCSFEEQTGVQFGSLSWIWPWCFGADTWDITSMLWPYTYWLSRNAHPPVGSSIPKLPAFVHTSCLMYFQHMLGNQKGYDLFKWGRLEVTLLKTQWFDVHPCVVYMFSSSCQHWRVSDFFTWGYNH